MVRRSDDGTSPDSTWSQSELTRQSLSDSTSLTRTDSTASSCNEGLEVVYPEIYKIRHTSAPRSVPTDTVNSQYPPRLNTVHPALRHLYLDEPVALSPEPENTWSPLARPAKHNNYHNFCKGAWQTRRSIHEGLDVAQGKIARSGFAPRWRCKHCAFAGTSDDCDPTLPDQVLTHSRSGIRYRWVFLANSHVPASTPYPRMSSYCYGCIFCAAQGRQTDVFENLDSLMSHITSKHKTPMLTPEVLAKTKCRVGGELEEADPSDILLPVSTERKLGLVGDLVAAAVGGVRSRSSSKDDVRS